MQILKLGLIFKIANKILNFTKTIKYKKMKKFALFLVFTLFTLNSFAQVSVRGYYKSNGTYVQPYQRTAPNNTVNDNYSTRGNTNPYTGEEGTKPRSEYNNVNSSYNNSSYNNSYNNSSSNYPTSSSYESNRTIYTGSRGGQYYINSNGNKTYIKN